MKLPAWTEQRGPADATYKQAQTLRSCTVRVAVIDIGTNSTRLLIADVAGRVVAEIERRSVVTRLGQGVDRSKRLDREAIERVYSVLDSFCRAIAERSVEHTVALATSAVREAANGAEFQAELERRFGLRAEVISGEREALLTYTGATQTNGSLQAGKEPLVVIDIGGGSTELVVGSAREVEFFVSTPIGAVRQSERHLKNDPPSDDELAALTNEVRSVIEADVPTEHRQSVQQAIAVAGTATSLAAVDQSLEPYDPDAVHGHQLSLASCRGMLRRLAAVPLKRRRSIRGLHPDRAATIVAGAVVLIQTLEAFALESVTVSEHDLLYGATVTASLGNPRSLSKLAKPFTRPRSRNAS